MDTAKKKSALVYICQWTELSNFMQWGKNMLLGFLTSIPEK